MRYAVMLCLLLTMLSGTALAQEKSVGWYTIKAEQLIDGGQFDEAIELLRQGVKLYPNEDHLRVLFGDALYLSKDIDAAEPQYRTALQLNPQNTKARNLVEVIRLIREYQESQGLALLKAVASDKAGELVVLAMGFFLGNMLSGFAQGFRERRFTKKSKRLFMVGQYDDFADMLEIQLTENNLRPLRSSVSFMLEHKSVEEGCEILSKYVNSEENLNTLLRM
ncbi:MAG: tetratricopeptide (TPR) repeat protein, partial [Halieaceae bacterium]